MTRYVRVYLGGGDLFFSHPRFVVEVVLVRMVMSTSEDEFLFFFFFLFLVLFPSFLRCMRQVRKKKVCLRGEFFFFSVRVRDRRSKIKKKHQILVNPLRFFSFQLLS